MVSWVLYLLFPSSMGVVYHIDVGPVPARYVQHSQMSPQLDMSDTNDKKTQDISDKVRCVRQFLLTNRKLCPTEVSEKN